MCVCVQYDIYSDQKRLKEVWFDSEGLYALVVTSALPPTERERVEAKKEIFLKTCREAIAQQSWGDTVADKNKDTKIKRGRGKMAGVKRRRGIFIGSNRYCMAMIITEFVTDN